MRTFHSPNHLRPLRGLPPQVVCGFLLLLGAAPLHAASPWAAFWTTPCILLASLLITWGAESAQFFVAQGFALAILAWMQTLPEFAVEAVLAWHQQTEWLLANLTGALRLLTGLAWPVIYLTAAIVCRRRTGQPLRKIDLDPHHSVEVVALFFPLVYSLWIWRKGTLELYDAAILVAVYGAYLFVLTRLPPQEHENIDDLDAIPRAIVRATKQRRIVAIASCFLIGGALIYLTAEPFLGSMVAVATAAGIPTFVVIQWFAPVISEFPELLSTFYFARQPGKAPVAIMNIASSNINQWTLLVAMLPVVYSLSKGEASGFALDPEQRSELLLTISQSMAALVFLFNMELAWWEAAAMFALFALQFILPAIFGEQSKEWVTAVFFLWVAGEVLAIAFGKRKLVALTSFVETWRRHVSA